MEFKGILKQILPMKEGETAKGKWNSQEILVETIAQFPESAVFNFFGDKCDQLSKLIVGTEITVNFNLKAKEYDGKIYNSLQGWKIDSKFTKKENSEPVKQTESFENIADLDDDSNLPF